MSFFWLWAELRSDPKCMRNVGSCANSSIQQASNHWLVLNWDHGVADTIILLHCHILIRWSRHNLDILKSVFLQLLLNVMVLMQFKWLSNCVCDSESQAVVQLSHIRHHYLNNDWSSPLTCCISSLVFVEMMRSSTNAATSIVQMSPWT